MADKKKKGNGKMTLQQARIQQRRVEVERLWLEGNSHEQIGRIMNLPQSTVNYDLKQMDARLFDEDLEQLKEVRLRSVARKLELYRKTIDAFHRSQQPDVTTTTDYEPVDCDACENGINKDENDFCDVCDGRGFRLVEKVTTKERGQAGDASHLETARKVLWDIDRLCGVASNKIDLEGQVNHVHIDAPADEVYRNMPDDALIRLRAEHQRARMTVEGRIVDDEPNGEEDQNE